MSKTVYTDANQWASNFHWDHYILNLAREKRNRMVKRNIF